MLSPSFPIKCPLSKFPVHFYLTHFLFIFILLWLKSSDLQHKINPSILPLVPLGCSPGQPSPRWSGSGPGKRESWPCLEWGSSPAPLCWSWTCRWNVSLWFCAKCACCSNTCEGGEEDIEGGMKRGDKGCGWKKKRRGKGKEEGRINAMLTSRFCFIAGRRE